MKKIIALLLCLASLCMLTACKNKEGEYKLSLGTVLSEDIGDMTVTSTSAAVVTDGQGKIVLCRLDSAETKAELTDKGVSGSVTEKSKHELGDGYGMAENSGAIAEWYKQAEYFESYVKGKTVVEVEQIKTGEAELASGCTIDVTDFVKAISAALGSDKKVSFTPDGEMMAGLGIRASVVDNGGNAEYLCDIAATVICGGKVCASVIDSSEATVTVVDGKGSEFIYSGTKNELGADYGMVSKGGAIAEWYEQAKAYAKSVEGKSASELSSLPVENVSGCTIDAEPLKAALVRAAENAR
ncbi:MAG: hypothetical protein IJ011_06185 [Clostridia bacterium]|nr:hypothetical protein [Clostridia bacterium]